MSILYATFLKKSIYKYYFIFENSRLIFKFEVLKVNNKFDRALTRYVLIILCYNNEKDSKKARIKNFKMALPPSLPPILPPNL